MSGEVVVPGDVVGVAEEYLPGGENVEADADGKLRLRSWG